jgi:hypothetical protein
MRTTKKTIEARLEHINKYTGLDYELQHATAYTYPYKIVSRNGSHDESQRMTASECVEWCNGFINAYFALYPRLKHTQQ